MKDATQAPDQVDLLIRHGYLLTMDDDGRPIEDGAIAVRGRGSSTSAPTPRSRLATSRPARSTPAGAPVHPGLIECHMHATFHTYRGAFSDLIPEDGSSTRSSSSSTTR